MGRPKFKAIKTGGQVTHDPRVGELGAKQSSSWGGLLVCERSRDGRKPKKKEYFVVILGIWRQDLDSQREAGSSLWSQTDGETELRRTQRQVAVQPPLWSIVRLRVSERSGLHTVPASVCPPLITNQSNTKWETAEISVPYTVNTNASEEGDQLLAALL